MWFYGQLAVDYKAKTKDQGAAKEAGVAAIERFAESFVHLRDLPMAFEEIPEMVAKARKAGAKDPILDLVGMLGHVAAGRMTFGKALAGHSYALPCFSAKNLFEMRDAVKAEYKEGLPLVMAEGMIVYSASDFRLSSDAWRVFEEVGNQVNPQAFIDAYAALATAYAKGPGLQGGLLDCWLWTIHDILGGYNAQIGTVNPASIPNMFLKVNDPKILAKHELFWGVAWEKQAFHPDLIQALKAIQAFHTGCDAKDKKRANAAQVFQANQEAAADLMAQVQLKNDTSNDLLLMWQLSGSDLNFPAALRMTLEAGFGPRFPQSAGFCKSVGGYHDYQPKKGVAMAWVLDEAQASERDEIAPLIAQLAWPLFETYPVGPNTPIGWHGLPLKTSGPTSTPCSPAPGLRSRAGPSIGRKYGHGICSCIIWIWPSRPSNRRGCANS